jgi:hypothetical protein
VRAASRAIAALVVDGKMKVIASYYELAGYPRLSACKIFIWEDDRRITASPATMHRYAGRRVDRDFAAARYISATYSQLTR